MGSGIHYSAQRPKTAKHLRGTTEKKFRNDNEEARIKYRQKMAARAIRRTKKHK